MGHTRYAACGAAAIALLSGCAGLPVPAAPPALTASASHDRKPSKSSRPCLYVANFNDNSITVYAANASGNTKPIETIEGSSTGLGEPSDIAVDADGKVARLAETPTRTQITTYSAGANGNVAPAQTIVGLCRKDLLGVDPGGVALDPRNGNIYVANTGGASVTIYPAGADGRATPVGSIHGSRTKLSQPAGLLLDGEGDIYVPNGGNNSIAVYAADSTGNAAPIRFIHGALTKLNRPYQVALDSNANIEVANYGSPYSVTVYAAGADGNVAPIRTIAGRATKEYGPDGIALDADNDTYVANYGSNWITVYAAVANGKSKPTGQLRGSRTGLAGPAGIALR